MRYRKPGLYNVTLRIIGLDGTMRAVTVTDVLDMARTESQQVLINTLRQGVLEKGAYATFVSASSDSYCSLSMVSVLRCRTVLSWNSGQIPMDTV